MMVFISLLNLYDHHDRAKEENWHVLALSEDMCLDLTTMQFFFQSFFTNSLMLSQAILIFILKVSNFVGIQVHFP